MGLEYKIIIVSFLKDKFFSFDMIVFVMIVFFKNFFILFFRGKFLVFVFFKVSMMDYMVLKVVVNLIFLGFVLFLKFFIMNVWCND